MNRLTRKERKKRKKEKRKATCWKKRRKKKENKKQEQTSNRKVIRRGGPRKSLDGVDPKTSCWASKRTRKTQHDGHNSGVKIWSLCSVSSSLSHANLEQPFWTLAIKWEVNIILKKSSCVFLPASLSCVVYYCVCYHCVGMYPVYICMQQLHTHTHIHTHTHTHIYIYIYIYYIKMKIKISLLWCHFKSKK